MRLTFLALLALLPGGVFAQSEKPSTIDDPTIDKMIAAGRSKEELARYLFDSHGCKDCHTTGRDGKLGFNEKGTQTAKGFDGCIALLTAMTVAVQVADGRRTPQQRLKVQHFSEFGCTACHRIMPGKMQLTAIGAKLAHLHLGCVDVEKVLAASATGK